MTVVGGACPCEIDVPDGAAGAVTDDEIITRFVPLESWLVWNDEGRPELTIAAFPKSELQGAKGNCASVLRDGIGRLELEARASDRNREPAWTALNDPVLATAAVADIRQLRSEKRRLACVNADPITDQIGPCPWHAGLVGGQPEIPKKPNLPWDTVREMIASRFTSITHFSGTVPKPSREP
jgi:hypothetical protein